MPDGNDLRLWLERSWYGRRRSWLAPLAMLFAAITSLRRRAFRSGLFASTHPGVPVVVVGNLTVGGTGKTPLVIWLARQLQQRGLRVGVVLRGYGGSAAGPLRVTASSDPAEVGDEAVLIAARTGCAVAVGRQRSAAAGLLAADGCEVVLSDDGLQHLALRRDLEIAVVDGARGFGNGALLPQGPLREQPGRLRTVAAVVINGPDATGISSSLAAPLAMSIEAEELRSLCDGMPQSMEALRGARVHAVAATGNPERFFALLRDLGCQPIEHAFADHHAFRQADLAFADPLPIIMTEKDAVKCRAFATDRMQYIQVSARFADADAARLLQLVQGCITKGERTHA
jgi:tetraacyldisaccharide 4'-kinase